MECTEVLVIAEKLFYLSWDIFLFNVRTADLSTRDAWVDAKSNADFLSMAFISGEICVSRKGESVTRASEIALRSVSIMVWNACDAHRMCKLNRDSAQGLQYIICTEDYWIFGPCSAKIFLREVWNTISTIWVCIHVPDRDAFILELHYTHLDHRIDTADEKCGLTPVGCLLLPWGKLAKALPLRRCASDQYSQKIYVTHPKAEKYACKYSSCFCRTFRTVPGTSSNKP